MVAAAAIGAVATTVGAGATIAAGNKAAKAQKAGAQSAADASERATTAQIEESRRQYDTTREDYAPYRQVGYGALGKLAGMYGVAPTNADGSPATVASAAGVGGSGLGYVGDGSFTASPGYEFRRSEGLRAIERSAAARGSLGSGGTLKASMRYADGLASSEYDQYANRLAALAGVGQSATGSTAAAGAASSGAITAALGANGQTQANAAIAAGNARASSYANTGSAINNGVQNLASTYFLGSRGGGTGFGSDASLYAGLPSLRGVY